MQNIIYRARNALFSAVILILFASVFSYFGYEPNEGFIKFYLLFLVAVPTLIVLWLVAFNSGKSKIDEYSIEFTKEGVRYLHMATLECISWSSFRSYKIWGIFNKTLTIYADDYKISLDFYLFDGKQQKNIIAKLREKC